MTYIKREDAIDYLATNMNWFDADGIETSEEKKRADITDLVNGVPSADVAPVVRCKDCKWWTEWSNGTGSCSRFALDWIGTDADDFCSMGERKDND